MAGLPNAPLDENPDSGSNQKLDVDLTDVIDLRDAGARWHLRWAGPFSPTAALAKDLEREVFVESLGYSADLVEAEFGGRDASSMWVVMADLSTGDTVGSCRLEVAPREELKVATDLRRWWGADLDRLLADRGVLPSDRIVEVLTASVAPSVRQVDNHWPVRALFAAGAYLVRRIGTKWLLQIQDVHGPDLMRRRFGLDYEVLGGLEPVDMLGPIVPSICHIGAGGFAFGDPDFADVFFNGDSSATGHTIVEALDPALVTMAEARLGIAPAS